MLLLHNIMCSKCHVVLYDVAGMCSMLRYVTYCVVQIELKSTHVQLLIFDDEINTNTYLSIFWVFVVPVFGQSVCLPSYSHWERVHRASSPSL